MNILVDITHPAQLHFFRFLIQKLRENGDEVLVTARRKDVLIDLLDALQIPFECLSRKRPSFLGMVYELIERDFRLWSVSKRFRPDVMLAQTGVSIGIVGLLRGVPRVVLDEAEYAAIQRAIGLPFANIIMTGTGYLKDQGRRQRCFKGVWVQSYLDPRYFTPDPEPLRRAGIEPDEPYIVLRMVSWSAVHDIGKRGAELEELQSAVEQLGRFGRVIISSEYALPESLRSYVNPLPAERAHDLLAFADLYIGEGGTMAAEAAVLGVPSICCSPLQWGYLRALESKYELLYNYDSLPEGLEKALELLSQGDLRQRWRHRREKLLAESEDIPAFMFELVRQTARKT